MTKARKSHIKTSVTARGFSYGEFKDWYGSECSIQDSSLATEACVWLGVDKPFEDSSGGTRMHLTKEMAEEIVVLLTRFIKTGSIS